MNKQGPRGNSVQQVAQQGGAAAQGRPTDVSIPHSIDGLVPEVELYRRLQEAEKRIDILTARKFADATDSIGKIPRKKELLRIFVYNTADNQPWQRQGQQVSGEEPSWTLRVEGRLVNGQNPDDPTRKKFSSLVSGVAVDLIPNNLDPSQQIPKENVIEWHEPQDPKAKTPEFDGLDIKRPGSENLKAKITIQPRDYPIKLKTSPELRSLVGVAETTQHDAVYAIWQYIQLNNLQAVDDKRIINCDESLSKLFRVPRFNFKEIIALLSRHLSPSKPIVLDYEIRVDKATTLGDLVIDVEVPVENFTEQEALKLESKRLVAEHDDSIKELNTKIVLGIQGLHNAHRKYQFYEKLSQDPVNFFTQFTESHSKLLKILSGDEGYNEENVRRSEFYTDELLQENVDILLKTNRI
jgi:chromatin remodeling complex protein RSC6